MTTHYPNTPLPYGSKDSLWVPVGINTLCVLAGIILGCLFSLWAMNHYNPPLGTQSIGSVAYKDSVGIRAEFWKDGKIADSITNTSTLTLFYTPPQFDSMVIKTAKLWQHK